MGCFLSQSPQHSLEKELQVEVEKITFHNPDNGWTVLRGRECKSYEQVTAVGHFMSPQAGETYLLLGRWNTHQSFGRQFKSERSVPMRPQTKSGMVRYLASGFIKGIGEKTAEKIVAHFGLNTFAILDKTPQRLKTVPKLSKRNADKIIRSWQEKTALTEALLFLGNNGVTPAIANRIINLYGPDAISVVSHNPYALIKDIHGLGFLTADRIALSVGIAKDSPHRLQEAILFQLKQGEDKGHCFLTEEQLVSGLSKLLELSQEQVRAQWSEHTTALLAEQLIAVNSSGGYFPIELYRAERDVAELLQQLMKAPFLGPEAPSAALPRIENWLHLYCQRSQITLSQGQKDAVVAAATHKAFILTGGPGVGKTTTANTIIQLFKAMNKKVFLAAPTGRAAQRLKEVSSVPAKTIHRLLEWSAEERGFQKNEDNKLVCDVLIVDESSMVDIRMMQSVLKATPLTSQLILIGDVDQLPSVGPGNVLRDLIESRAVPFVKLTEIFRQAAHSQIIQIAHHINKGELPRFDNKPGEDCHFLEADQLADVAQVVKKLVTDSLPNAGYNAIQDVQILTPMNRGDLGGIRLNEELQGLLNPPRSDDKPFLGRNSLSIRPRDKVIQTVNNYDLAVFNGDIGFVEQTHVEGGKVLVRFADRLVPYSEDEALDLNLAYAITIHKSQGSEFPVVVIPLTMTHYVMLQKNLIYTALTRAKKLAIFVGSKQALSLAISQEGSHARQTNLRSYFML